MVLPVHWAIGNIIIRFRKDSARITTAETPVKYQSSVVALTLSLKASRFCVILHQSNTSYRLVDKSLKMQYL